MVRLADLSFGLVLRCLSQEWPTSISSWAKTDNFQILSDAYKFMALKVRGNLIYTYSIINKHFLLDRSILLGMHKMVKSCLSGNYIYC